MICSKLGIPGRIYTAAVCFCDFKACPLLLILMEVDSCQNCDYGLHNIKCEEASVNKSEALAGQSRSFLLSDYINDVEIAFI